MNINQFLLNIFYVIAIICYAVLFSSLFSYGVNIKRGHYMPFNSEELGAVTGVLILFGVTLICAF